jgi:hypothetical protein
MDVKGRIYASADLTSGNNPGVHRTDWARFTASLEYLRRGSCLTHVGIRTPNRPAHSVVTILTILSNENNESNRVSKTDCSKDAAMLRYYQLVDS